MKNRKRVIGAFLLVAILLLGVGYANLTDTLIIDGTAGVDLNDSKEEFEKDVYFSKVISGTGCSAVINTDPDEGTITVNDGALKAVGDEVIATYTIKSDSDLDVTVAKPTITNDNTEYFQVTSSWTGDTTIQPNGTADVTVTVKLIKTAASDENVSFGLSFNVTGE